MYNFTETVGTTTSLAQNISEEAVTGLVNNSSSKSMNDNMFVYIHMYGLLILIPLGIVLNSVSLTVFQKSKAFSTSTGNHLKGISVSDTIILVGLLLTNTNKYWEETLGFPDIHAKNNMSSKISTFILGVGNASAGLIMSSATIERFLAIAFPLKYRSWNTIRPSKIMLTVFFI